MFENNRFLGAPVAIAIAASLGLGPVLLPATALAQWTVTEIIDSSGAGAGNPLSGAWGIAVDGAGNVYSHGILE